MIYSKVKTILILIGLMAIQSTSYSQKVLIYTKNGEGYVHDNIEASVKFLEKICKSLNLEYHVSDKPEVFNASFQNEFKLVIFSNTNNEAFNTQDQRDVFKEFINQGGGFVGIHSACGSERKWPWFWAMVGGKFLRHPALQPFDIKIIDSSHSSTKKLPQVWKWEDECYYLDNLNPDIHVLLAADLSTLKDKDRDKYPGTTFGDLFPLAWYHTYDGGRQFYTALGHKIEYYQDENFIEHIKGGIEWVLEIEEK